MAEIASLHPYQAHQESRLPEVDPMNQILSRKKDKEVPRKLLEIATKLKESWGGFEGKVTTSIVGTTLKPVKVIAGYLF